MLELEPLTTEERFKVLRTRRAAGTTALAAFLRIICCGHRQEILRKRLASLVWHHQPPLCVTILIMTLLYPIPGAQNYMVKLAAWLLEAQRPGSLGLEVITALAIRSPTIAALYSYARVLVILWSGSEAGSIFLLMG